MNLRRQPYRADSPGSLGHGPSFILQFPDLVPPFIDFGFLLAPFRSCLMMPRCLWILHSSKSRSAPPPSPLSLLRSSAGTRPLHLLRTSVTFSFVCTSGFATLHQASLASHLLPSKLGAVNWLGILTSFLTFTPRLACSSVPGQSQSTPGSVYLLLLAFGFNSDTGLRLRPPLSFRTIRCFGLHWQTKVTSYAESVCGYVSKPSTPDVQVKSCGTSRIHTQLPFSNNRVRSCSVHPLPTVLSFIGTDVV